MAALELEKLYAAAAKERQTKAGEIYGRGKVVVDLPQPIERAPKAIEQAGAKMKVSGASIQHAKKVAAVAPDLAKAQVEISA
jgi:hypothetical protein